ncbi:GNAT family N-acetyltransferase [Chania multitudinisentens]|uniref:GNAT family N-acetyltransferase n=1 Tax=Chania multitudinisentens TaxID=1639108 RepID=UPI0004641EE0|nr:GNAT family N-acetyltransferase [Chania multitudinisentens]
MYTIDSAVVTDAEHILALQKLAYQSEARLYQDWNIPPLTQSMSSLITEFSDHVILKAVIDGAIVGSVRAKADNNRCLIGKLIVQPEYQGRGIGSALLAAIETHFPSVSYYQLFTGSLSSANIRLYQRNGYCISHSSPLSDRISIIFLEKAASSQCGKNHHNDRSPTG